LLFFLIEIGGHSVVLGVKQAVVDDEGQRNDIEYVLLDQTVILSHAVKHCFFVAQQSIARHMVVDSIAL
jgi:hypothetical protein